LQIYGTIYDILVISGAFATELQKCVYQLRHVCLSVWIPVCNNSKAAERILMNCILENWTKICHHVAFNFKSNNNRHFAWLGGESSEEYLLMKSSLSHIPDIPTTQRLLTQDNFHVIGAILGQRLRLTEQFPVTIHGTYDSMHEMKI
jgi:hypothetical protein